MIDVESGRKECGAEVDNSNVVLDGMVWE